MSVGDRYSFEVGTIVIDVAYPIGVDPETHPDREPVTRWVAHERSGIVQHVTLDDLEHLPAQEKP